MYQVRLYDWFESKDKYYLVFELASGGDLFSRIWSDGKFTEADAASIITDILVSFAINSSDGLPARKPSLTRLSRGVSLYRKRSGTYIVKVLFIETSSQRTCSSQSPILCIFSFSNAELTANLSLNSARDGADTVMLADFGIAKHLAPGEKLTVPAGSPGYAGKSLS